MPISGQVRVRLDEELQSQDRPLDRPLQHFEVLQPEGGRRTRSEIRQTAMSRPRRNAVGGSGSILIIRKTKRTITRKFLDTCSLEMCKMVSF